MFVFATKRQKISSLCKNTHLRKDAAFLHFRSKESSENRIFPWKGNIRELLKIWSFPSFSQIFVRRKLLFSYSVLFFLISVFYNFLPSGHSSFMWNFRKILWAILDKKCLPIDILTYWPTNNGDFKGSFFCLNSEVQKSTLKLQQFLRYISFKRVFGLA